MEDFYHASSETDNAKEQWGGGTVRMALRVKEGTQRSKLPIRDPGGAGLKRGWRKGSDGEKRGWVPPS